MKWPKNPEWLSQCCGMKAAPTVHAILGNDEGTCSRCDQWGAFMLVDGRSLGKLKKAQALAWHKVRSHIWLMDVLEHAVAICEVQGFVHCDDIWEVCPPPVDRDPRVMGAAFQTSEAKEIFRATAKVASKRPSVHASEQFVYVFNVKGANHETPQE